jgi:hypothetical protein
MAAIDKTYTDSYIYYKEFKDWADTQIVTFFDGHKVCIGDYVWNYQKENFDGRSIPIMNTPIWMDIYLIQNCKSQFVIDRMKQVYGDDFERYKNMIDLTKTPEGCDKNRKIVFYNSFGCKFPFKRKMFKKPIGKNKWVLQCDDDFWYNEETKTWSQRGSFYPYNTNTAFFKSTKAVVRHLRKQYLPVGLKFTLSGRYVGEDYEIIIK